MNTRLTTALFLLLPAATMAQVPVDENGRLIGDYESQAEVMPIGEDGIPRLSHSELQDLVGPVALYPDDLLAIVLPATAYPLQVVEAARFLEALETDPTLQPDPEWDDSIVALINYPEVVELLNDDLDWTWRLGESVVAQQTDVIAAVESFRDRAYAAGNLKSDEYQTVANEAGTISISPAAEDVIYVPYYEPTRVVYYQPRPAYYYHPRPYPVYYYPYPVNHRFDRGPFWGVTTAFSIGWYTNSVNVYHHSYRGHPYYGRTYWNDGWYRRPSINVYNTTYVDNTNITVNRRSNGDNWRPRDDRRQNIRREGYVRSETRSAHRGVTRDKAQDAITFRTRSSRQVGAESQRRDAAITKYRGDRQTAVQRNQAADRRNNIEQYRVTDRARKTSTNRTEVVRQTREQAPARTKARTTAPRESRPAESRPQARTPAPRESRSQKPRSSSKSKTRKPSNRPKPRDNQQH